MSDDDWPLLNSVEEAIIDPKFLLGAYRMGVFPMAMDDGEIGWFSPDPRGVIPLAEFHIPHGLKKILKKAPFEVRWNTSFAEVIKGCADRESTWINELVLATYTKLHELGFGKSVETWANGRLVGGLYGVALGGVFFGESMFSRESQASQVALVHLVQRMKERGFTVLDTQWTTPHLERFGAIAIPKSDYMDQLAAAIDRDVSLD